MNHTPYHHVRKHFRKHKKHYVRFFAFFIFLLIFAVLEDSIVAFATGAPFVAYTLVIIFIVSLIFTMVAEYTEKIFEKEAEEVADIVVKEENKIKRIEKKFWKK